MFFTFLLSAILIFIGLSMVVCVIASIVDKWNEQYSSINLELIGLIIAALCFSVALSLYADFIITTLQPVG